MPRPSLSDLRALPDLKTTYRWNLSFISVPTGLDLPVDRDINIRCESVELPKLVGQTTQYNIRGFEVRQPGRYSYSESLTLIFLETVDNFTSLFFKTWRELVWTTDIHTSVPKNLGLQNPVASSLSSVANVAGNLAAGVGVDARIRLELLNNQDEPIWEYVIIGCFPQEVDPGQLNSESEALKTTVILSYDFFRDGPVGTGNISIPLLQDLI